MSRRKKPAAAAPRPLPDRLDFAAAGPLAAALLAARGAPLVLDAAPVRHLGAPGAQVLLAARRTWAADGQPFRIAAPSPAFAEGARLLGLAAELDG